MKNDILIPLLNNAVLLLALATVYDLLAAKAQSGKSSLFRKIITGLALGFLGIGLILASVCFAPGIVFDTRSVLLSVSGLFFGAVPTGIAMAMTATFRLLQGGTAAYAGTAVILATGSIGLVWRRRRNPLEQIQAKELYVFGIINHAVMLALMFLMPFKTAVNVVAVISGPVLLIYPLLTVAFGLLLAGRLRRQRTAEALAESETTYRNIFQNNHAVMLLVDPENGNIVDANPAACSFYGWTAGEFSRMKISQINTLPADTLQFEMENAQASRRNVFRFRHRLADGSIRDVETLTGPVTIEGRKLLYSIIQDITERSRSEEERTNLLDAAEQARHALLSVIEDQKLAEAKLLRLSAAINQAAEAVIITDTKGTVQYVNPAFETITGYSSDEITGKNTRELKSGQHDRVFYADLWKTITSGKTWEGRIINKRKNGELYTEDVSISPVRDSSGIITGYVSVTRDITEELTREELFRQSQKMEAVGQLAGGIAHDFNNLLQAILGFSELLLNRLKQETPEHRNVLEIQKAAKRAADLTRQLLAFSRKQPVNLQRININTTIQDAEVLLKLLLGDRIKCRLELPAEPVEIFADHGQITQIIMNLAVNARDAMPDGGRLTIAAETITVQPRDTATMPESAPGTFVCLSVTDTGCGMNREVKDRLFEPFFTTKEIGKGTGLGLAVIYGIVKQNKGWINVYSEEGLGTTFKIYLPACRKPDAVTGKSGNPAQADHVRILLVEDDDEICQMVIRILGSAGYETATARDAEEAVRLFEEEKGRFDLLFSDMVLPGKTGLELADALRSEKAELPVLLYSGYQDQRERWKNLAGKGYHFLQKPFSLTGLLAAVHETLSEQQHKEL